MAKPKKLTTQRLSRIHQVWELYLDRVPVSEIAKKFGVSVETINRDISRAKELLLVGAGDKLLDIAQDALAEHYKLLRSQWRDLDRIEKADMKMEEKFRLRIELYKSLQKTIETLEDISGLKGQRQAIQQNLNQIIVEPKEAGKKIVELWSQTGSTGSLPPPSDTISINDEPIIDIDKL